MKTTRVKGWPYLAAAVLVHTANEHNRAVRGERSGLVVGPSPVGGVAIGFRLRR